MDNDVDYELDYEQIISSKMMSRNDYISLHFWYDLKLSYQAVISASNDFIFANPEALNDP